METRVRIVFFKQLVFRLDIFSKKFCINKLIPYVVYQQASQSRAMYDNAFLFSYLLTSAFDVCCPKYGMVHWVTQQPADWTTGGGLPNSFADRNWFAYNYLLVDP